MDKNQLDNRKTKLCQIRRSEMTSLPKTRETFDQDGHYITTLDGLRF